MERAKAIILHKERAGFEPASCPEICSLAPNPFAPTNRLKQPTMQA